MRPWTTPLGVWLHERLTAVVERTGGFRSPARSLSRGITLEQVQRASTLSGAAALQRLGWRQQGGWRVEVTTNRPGAGASFRQGEEMRYFVTSTMDGYLYLFHVDAAGRFLRVFPNKSEPNNAGAALEIPGRGAPYRFVAAPPFGLETTVALVTSQPLDEREFRVAAGGVLRARPGDPGPGHDAGPPSGAEQSRAGWEQRRRTGHRLGCRYGADPSVGPTGHVKTDDIPTVGQSTRAAWSGCSRCRIGSGTGSRGITG
jgi:hypothetical protein